MSDSDVLSISVVIPIYNNGLTIERALRSIIVHQNIDIEVIVIDDGSNDDGCLKAIEALNELGFNHFKVLCNLNNQGAYFSRNLGVFLACKTYVMFLDGDDQLSDDCLDTLYSFMVLNHPDIVLFDILLKQYNASDVIMHSLNREITNPELIDYVKALPSPCNKLVRRSIYTNHHIQFPNTIYEDLATSYRLMLHANEIRYIAKPLYIYHKATSGNVSSITDSRITQLYDVIENMLHDLSYCNHGFSQQDLMDIAVAALFNQYLMVLTIEDHDLVKKFYCQSIELLNTYFDDQWKHHAYFGQTNIQQKLIRSMLKSKWSYRLINRISWIRRYIRHNYQL